MLAQRLGGAVGGDSALDEMEVVWKSVFGSIVVSIPACQCTARG